MSVDGRGWADKNGCLLMRLDDGRMWKAVDGRKLE